MRIRTLWFAFFVSLMLLLPPLFAQMSPADGSGPAVAADGDE